MTFRHVILKNFTGGFKKYFAYFLSASFSIMLFFMYATLILNKDLNGRDDTEAMSYIFPITMVAIAVFSVFFINYAHTAFVKGRNKEFGVYITLGMDSKELRNLVNLENIFIGSLSLATGLLVGTLFSRLFQMVILSLLEIKDIKFHINYRPYLLTFAAFFLIFATVIVRNYFRMRKMDIASLMMEDKKDEGKKYSSMDLILGGLGLAILMGSIVLLVIVANNEDLNSNPFILLIYMAISFFGVYLCIAKLGNLIIHLLKKSKYYYRNILSITELYHKFNQNKKIIFILSVLSTMTIFLVASPFSLFRLSETIAEMDKNHLEYVKVGSINVLPEGELEKTLQKQEVSSNKRLKFLFLNTKEGSKELSSSKPVISVEEYNSLTGNELHVNKGEAYNIVIDWTPGNHGIEPGKSYTFYNGGYSYSYNFKDSRSGDWIAGIYSFPTNSIIVINSEDYELLSAESSEANTGYYHLINFKNWKDSKEVVTAIKNKLGNSELKISSTIENYESLRKAYSVFLFLSTVMGIMFFVAGGSVLYFKQYTELAESQRTFKKLFKIGISYKEMKSIVGKELLAVFFIPLIFGAFLGVSLIYLMTYIVGGDAIIKEFLSNATVVIVIYFVSQGIFYVVTKNKYVHEIVKCI